MKPKNGKDLEWLLDYELTQSARHRRFVSLVMLSANGNTKKLDRMLGEAVRNSDALFFISGAVAVLMGETDRSGALQAVGRYQDEISDSVDVRYAVSSFPGDGRATSEMMDVARRRLNMAMELENGSVVDQG